MARDNASASKRAARKRVRRRRGADAAARRRVAALKAVAVVVVLAALLALALIVGDGDYQATVIGWAPFVAAVVTVLLAYVYLRLLVWGLSFTEDIAAADCKRGREVPYTVRLRNRTPLVFFRLRLVFFISDMFGNTAHRAQTTIALGPYESYDLQFAARFEHIGSYEAGLQSVEVSDFLGLFTRRLSVGAHRRVDVTPQLQLLERVNFDDSATVETSRAAKSVLADSMDYAQVREYVPGDPLKTIHWKLSAHSRAYMTRLFEVYKDPGVAVILDFCGNSEDAEELMGMFDAVVEAGFSIASYCKRKGMDTEVLFTNKYGDAERAFDWGDEGMPELVSRMPQMSGDPAKVKGALDIVRKQVMSQHGQSTLVVCSASMDASLLSAVVDAKVRRRSPFMVAVVPRELEGRPLDAYCKPLAQLDAANIPYVVIGRSEELGVKLL